MKIQTEVLAKEKTALIKRLENKEETLSFSSIKAFGQSPALFMSYKLEPPKPPSEGVLLGSICDWLLSDHVLDEGSIYDRFVVVDEIPTTENQIGFCSDVLDGIDPEEAFANHYKFRGMVNSKASKFYDKYKPYLEAKAKGKETITEKMLSQAYGICYNLRGSEKIKKYYSDIETFQKDLSWEYKGWKFKGVVDAVGINADFLIDFKYTNNAHPRKFEKAIYEYDYFMQLGMYAQAFSSIALSENHELDYVFEMLPRCIIIAYDKQFNYMDFELTNPYILYGIRKYKYLVRKLNECVAGGHYYNSFGFFHDHGRAVEKPRWAEGFI